MPYLRKHAPGTPRKSRIVADDAATPTAMTTATTTTAASTAASLTTTATSTTTITTRIVEQTETTSAASAATLMAIGAAERTPPQEARVPEIGDATTPAELVDANAKRKRCPIEPTTPVLPPAARKQSAITVLAVNIETWLKRIDPTVQTDQIGKLDRIGYVVAINSLVSTVICLVKVLGSDRDFMKSRKRGLNGTTKSMIEPPEKIARNAGQIRS
ncbi:hypothetical protein EAI_07043 [Harpegnathos saltator]|uniref:Uncharacterized protein n=1 Tax=Harpegnathos saltator TaxID=610380 RepID=E2BVE8_HARSA|nr:hypothetical protein EAI_07043 [Harpegnathos saltator]